KRDRRYPAIFEDRHGSLQAAFPGTDPTGPCPFAGDTQQPMRNRAIAEALMHDGLVEEAWFMLCAHPRNAEIAEGWQRWQALLGDTARAPCLRPTDVIDAGREAGHHDWADWMCYRYDLGAAA